MIITLIPPEVYYRYKYNRLLLSYLHLKVLCLVTTINDYSAIHRKMQYLAHTANLGSVLCSKVYNSITIMDCYSVICSSV